MPTTVVHPSGMTWIVLDVALAPLAPGEYAVDVNRGQGDARQLTAFRILP